MDVRLGAIDGAKTVRVIRSSLMKQHFNSHLPGRLRTAPGPQPAVALEGCAGSSICSTSLPLSEYSDIVPDRKERSIAETWGVCDPNGRRCWPPVPGPTAFDCLLHPGP